MLRALLSAASFNAPGAKQYTRIARGQRLFYTVLYRIVRIYTIII